MGGRPLLVLAFVSGAASYAVAQQPYRLVAQPLEPDPLPAPGHVEEQVGGDPVQPPLEGARGVAGERAEHPDEDLLGQVLGVVLVAGEPVGQPVDPRRVLAHQVVPARGRPFRCRAVHRRHVLNRCRAPGRCRGLGHTGIAHVRAPLHRWLRTTIMSPLQVERVSRPR